MQLGLARMDHAVEFAIWKHSTFEGGVMEAIKHRPAYPQPPSLDVPEEVLRGLYIQAVWPETMEENPFFLVAFDWMLPIVDQWYKSGRKESK